MSEVVCIHCYVTGKVQGVFFRAKTKEQADQLQLTGWVRNLQDGRVEVLACGDKKAVMALYAWLKQGPKTAEVKDLTFEELPWQVLSGFEIMPTL